jgi:hypothetical protein
VHAHNHSCLATKRFQEEQYSLSAHSTAEAVNSEDFQDANGVKELMECKKVNDDARKTVYSFS